jgi:hypothetical protein
MEVGFDLKKKEQVLFVFCIDQRQRIASPDGGDMEKHFSDAKSYIVSSTTKEGVNL